MKYKNKKTGAIIVTDSVICGEQWEEVKPSANTKESKKPAKK